jgi:hypothetical protein
LLSTPPFWRPVALDFWTTRAPKVKGAFPRKHEAPLKNLPVRHLLVDFLNKDMNLPRTCAVQIKYRKCFNLSPFCTPNILKHRSRCTDIATSRRVPGTIVTVEKQCVLHIVSVCL